MVTAHYVINITLHILILFTFLTIFFFAYISQIEKKSIDDVLQNAISDQMNEFLTKLEEMQTKLPYTVDWNALYKFGKTVQQETIGEYPDVTQNHRNLMILASCGIAGIFLFLIGAYIYSRYMGYEVPLKRIIIENIAVFAFVGVIEMFFFMYVASKYVPVTPDILGKSVLTRIKYNLNKYLADEPTSM
jgi:hypothetical protein